MLRRIAVLLVIPLMAAGCSSAPPADNGNDNDNDNTSSNGGGTVVNVDLGTIGVFASAGLNGVNAGGVVDISANVPAAAPSAVEVFLDPADVSFGGATDVASTDVFMLITLTSPDAADPCTEAVKSYEFDMTLTGSGASNITPDVATLDETGAALAATGRFGVCITVVSNEDAPITFSRFRLRFK